MTAKLDSHFVKIIVLLVCMSLVYNNKSYVLIMLLFIMCYMLYHYDMKEIENMIIKYTGLELKNDHFQEKVNTEITKLKDINKDLSPDVLLKKVIDEKKSILKNVGYDLEGKTEDEIKKLSQMLINSLISHRSETDSPTLVDDCSSCTWKVSQSCENNIKGCEYQDTKGLICAGSNFKEVNGQNKNILGNCRPGICASKNIKKVFFDGQEQSYVGTCNPADIDKTYNAILDSKNKE